MSHRLRRFLYIRSQLRQCFIMPALRAENIAMNGLMPCMLDVSELRQSHFGSGVSLPGVIQRQRAKSSHEGIVWLAGMSSWRKVSSKWPMYM